MLEGAERELMGVAGAPYRLAGPLSRIANHYAAIVIDTRSSFSFVTEMGLLATTDAIDRSNRVIWKPLGYCPSYPKSLRFVKAGDTPLHVSGIVVTKMDMRVKGHKQLLDARRAHSVLTV